MTTSAPYSLTTSRDFVAVGRDEAAVDDVERQHALPHADDERQAGEDAKRFAGEARRAQAGWDYGERPHSWRSVGVALTAAIFTR